MFIQALAHVLGWLVGTFAGRFVLLAVFVAALWADRLTD